MKVYVVIPAYNEVISLPKVINGVRKYIENIIVVNDCSSDNTKNILRKLKVCTINNEKNEGYLKSLEKGMRHAFAAGADYVITYDADAQHSPSDLANFLAVITHKKPGIIIGHRSFFNRIMENFIGLLCGWRFGFKDPLSGFKAYRRDVYLKFSALEHSYSIGMEILFRAKKAGIKIMEINITFNKRVGSAKFGNTIKGNFYELKALINMLPYFF